MSFWHRWIGDRISLLVTHSKRKMVNFYIVELRVILLYFSSIRFTKNAFSLSSVIVSLLSKLVPISLRNSFINPSLSPFIKLCKGIWKDVWDIYVYEIFILPKRVDESIPEHLIKSFWMYEYVINHFIFFWYMSIS